MARVHRGSLGEGIVVGIEPSGTATPRNADLGPRASVTRRPGRTARGAARLPQAGHRRRAVERADAPLRPSGRRRQWPRLGRTDEPRRSRLGRTHPSVARVAPAPPASQPATRRSHPEASPMDRRRRQASSDTSQTARWRRRLADRCSLVGLELSFPCGIRDI